MLKGKKTYLTGATLIGLGVASLLHYPVPEGAWLILSGLGMGSLRSAITTS